MTIQDSGYLPEVIHETYDLLTSPKIEWPDYMTQEMKCNTISAVIKVLEGMEEYEKCTRLTQLLNEVRNDKPKSNKRVFRA